MEDNFIEDIINILHNLGLMILIGFGIGLNKFCWQSVLTTEISLNNLKEIEYKMSQEKWGNCGIIMPHIEAQDIQNSREKVLKFLEENIGKQGLVSIKDIANQLNLTEEFILIILKEFGMDITEGT